jgi:hypothetical protein
VSVGFGVSLRVRDEVVDPAAMLTAVEALVQGHGIEVYRAGNVVRFTARQRSALVDLAVPLAAWWQEHGPVAGGDVALRFVGTGGVTELTYCRPDLAVEYVRHTIESESGPVYLPGEVPGMVRRLAASVVRAARTGFTASELRVDNEGPCLRVAVAGRELDDKPRHIELQAFNPGHDDYDPDDDEGYCLVNEEQIPVYGGLVGLRLTGRALHLRLTDEAAREWALRSTRMAIVLGLDRHEIDELRTALQRLFAYSSQRWPSPRLDFNGR